MKTMLVLGADSLVGQSFTRYHENFKIYGTYDYTPISIKNVEMLRLDLKFSSQILSTVDSIRPDLIINAAGKTNIDYCETNPIDSYLTNELAVKNIIIAAKKNNSFLIQVSTDLVFDGFSKKIYSELDSTNPISVLGKNKLNAELEIRQAMENYLIIRTGPVFGWNCINRTKNYVTWILENLKAKKEISLVTDQYSNYTFNDYLSDTALKLFNAGKTGTFNIVSKNCVSQYELGLIISKIFNLDRTLISQTNAKKARFVAHIPRYACLDTSKLRNETGTDTEDLESMLITMRDHPC